MGGPTPPAALSSLGKQWQPYFRSLCPNLSRLIFVLVFMWVIPAMELYFLTMGRRKRAGREFICWGRVLGVSAVLTGSRLSPEMVNKK